MHENEGLVKSFANGCPSHEEHEGKRDAGHEPIDDPGC